MADHTEIVRELTGTGKTALRLNPLKDPLKGFLIWLGGLGEAALVLLLLPFEVVLLMVVLLDTDSFSEVISCSLDSFGDDPVLLLVELFLVSSPRLLTLSFTSMLSWLCAPWLLLLLLLLVFSFSCTELDILCVLSGRGGKEEASAGKSIS